MTTTGNDKATSELRPEKSDAGAEEAPPPIDEVAAPVDKADKPTTGPAMPKARESWRPGGPASLIGLTLSERYKIERLIGEGGMGAVYQAEHTLMRKRLAVKVLHPEMSRMREVVARFEREARAAAHIDHPNVATATDFGKLDDGSFFLVLEYIEGIALRQLVAQGPLALPRALNITRQIAAALVRAHSLGIVHRDLKPENVMLVDRDGDPDFVKVLDFGIAKVPVGEIGEMPHDPSQPVLTQAGMVYGTPEYMAPEQALGNPVDARADLYAVGVMAYEMLTGSRPFDAESKVKILGMQVTAPVPPMSADLRVPKEVEDLVKKLLEKEASDRFQDAKELLDALNAIISVLVSQGTMDAPPTSVAAPTSTIVSQGPNASGGAFAVAPTAAVILPSGPEPKWKRAVGGVVARAKSNPRVAAFAGGGALLFLVVFTIGLAAFKAHASGTNLDADGGVATSTSASGSVSADTSANPPPSSNDAKVREAIALVDKGDYASGIDRLTALPDDVLKRPDARRALASAYAATEKYDDCMRIVSAWLADDPPISADQKVRVMIRDAAISNDAVATDLAFGLLEKHMGTVGLDDMYDIAYGASGQYNQKARDRARTLLKKPALRTRMTPALSVTLDLAQVGLSCKAKTFFDRAATDGDLRTVAVLKPLVPRAPSGWFGKQDALQCVHDGSLTKTIAAIESRTK